MLEQWQSACDNILNGGGCEESEYNSGAIGSYANGGGGGGGNLPVTASYDQLNNASAGGTMGRGGGAASAAGGGGGGSSAQFDTLSDKDSISLHAHSVTASHVEKTLSEVVLLVIPSHVSCSKAGLPLGRFLNSWRGRPWGVTFRFRTSGLLAMTS